jgi:ATP-dependent Clp protease ATP-binding subunit ClpC
VKVSFNVGVFMERIGSDQRWTALVPPAHAVEVTGANEVKLRENLVDRLRGELGKAHPAIHEQFHLHAGTRLERVHVDVAAKLDGPTKRISGTFPIVCVPRWFDDETQRLVCFHPKHPSRWFAADDAAQVAELAPHFARHAWSDLVDGIDAMKATGKERLGMVSFTAEPKSLLEDVKEKEGRQRASGSKSHERVLARLGVDLTAQAVNKSLAMGVPREPYRSQIARLLGGTRMRSTVLVGRPGVGKRTLLARWIGDRLEEDGFSLHRNLDRIHHVWRVSGKRIIAGMSYMGDWEKRCLAIADEARRYKAILWFDDLHLFGRIGQSRQSDRSLADFFRGPVQRGELTIVSALTPEQLQRLEDDAPALASLLVRLPIHAASPVETQELLLTEIRELEQRLAVDVHPFVPRTAIELGGALFPWTALPGAAVDLVRKVAEANAPTGAERADVGPPEVVRHLARTTGLAEHLLSLEEVLKPDEVEAAFARRVMGQPEAIASAADIVMRVRAGLADPSRPLGVYLFTGPTGTGKTELATALAEYLYGDVSRLLRLDMSELSGPDAPARLIGDRGSPEGLLTQRIREQPFSVVLLDEIEKAHPSVMTLMLQLFDEGRLTDASGNAASFAHAVIVMTSNLGAKPTAPIGFGDHEGAILAEVARAVREFFPPELWNRIDRIVPFRPLSAETAARVVDKELQRLLARRGLRERSVFVYAGTAVKQRAVAEAFDPRYGARTVKRWLEDRIGGLLADELARGGEAHMRVVRLIEQQGSIALHVEPLREVASRNGPYALEGLFEKPASAMLVPAAAEAHALAGAANTLGRTATAKPGDRHGEVLWAVDRLGSRLRDLATILGGDLPRVRARRDTRDDEAHAELRKRRGPIDRDTALAGLAEGNLLRRHLQEVADPDAHVVTISMTRVGHGRGKPTGAEDPVAPGTLGWLARYYLGAGWLGARESWLDAGCIRRLDGSVVELAVEPRRGAVSPEEAFTKPVSHVVLVLRDVLLRAALAGDHGSHVFRSLAGEPEILRVEITPGARDPRQLVIEHGRKLTAFEDAVDRGVAGAEVPPNPEHLLPVVRTVAWRAPLRVGESWRVELEDFGTGWSPTLEVSSVEQALRFAWWLRWSEQS